MSEVSDPSVLKECSIISRSFRFLSQKRLFRSVVFCVDKWEGDSVWRKFSRAIQDNQAIAAHVRVVTVSLPRCLESGLFYAMAMQNAATLGVLGLMPNVHIFRLDAGQGVYPHTGFGDWFDLPCSLKDDILSLMKKSTLTVISISGFITFPIHALSCCTALERLDLNDVFFSFPHTCDLAWNSGSLAHLRTVNVAAYSFFVFTSNEQNLPSNRRFFPTKLTLRKPIVPEAQNALQLTLNGVGEYLEDLKFAVDCTSLLQIYSLGSVRFAKICMIFSRHTWLKLRVFPPFKVAACQIYRLSREET